MKAVKAPPQPPRTPVADFLFRESLDELDPDTGLLSRWEEDRQGERIVLIASESIAPRAVREAMATAFA
ncbi:MAG: hypothetical protein IT452_05460, partial [Planctomycetia bacterium]|nr:hypothetical protein [Planctomycetia bacterium]